MNHFNPVTGNCDARPVQKIRVEKIIEGYQAHFDLDVSPEFDGIDEFFLCECPTTGVQFYSPRVEGSEDLYEGLQDFDWYYLDSRWEHELAQGFLSSGQRLLEVGCGRGGFLDSAQQLGVDAVGLELNDAAVQHCVQKGLKVFNKTLNEFRRDSHLTFDCLAAFQVLEHIYHLNDFLKDCVGVLKAGGKAMFSVPNNNNLFFRGMSDLHYEEDCLLLNLPPHHANRFNTKSLSLLGDLHGLSVDGIYFQPIWDARIPLISKRMIQRLPPGKPRDYLEKRVGSFVQANRHRLKGDSLAIFFTKTH